MPTGASAFVDDVATALYASKIVAYAQGFEQMAAAGDRDGWDVDQGGSPPIWRGGCIIRARFLDKIKEAFDRDPGLPNLLLDEYFRDAVARPRTAGAGSWPPRSPSACPPRPSPASLAYYDGYRRDRLPGQPAPGPARLLRRPHLRRIDRPGTFHTLWSDNGQEVEV